MLYNITVFREFRFLMAFLHEIFLYFSMLKKKSLITQNRKNIFKIFILLSLESLSNLSLLPHIHLISIDELWLISKQICFSLETVGKGAGDSRQPYEGKTRDIL